MTVDVVAIAAAMGVVGRLRKTGRRQRLHPVAFAALAAFAASLSLAPSARAFCREVTESPPAGYDPADSGCFGFADGGPMAGLHPLFWRNECVGYSLQASASKYVSLADAKRVAGQAFAAWSSADCSGGPPSIAAVAFPEVNCNSVPSSGHNNVIIFHDTAWPYDDSANALGYTTLTVDLSTGEIVGADTEINSAQWPISAEAPPPPNGYDFATIMTHEAGHFLGLAHTGDSTAVMYARYHEGTTLQADDVNAICSVYRPDGTHETNLGPVLAPACDPAPPGGFESTTCGSFDAGTFDLLSVGSGAGPSTGTLGPSCPPDPSGCAVGGGARPWTLGLGTAGIVTVVGLLRGVRRSRRRKTAAGAVFGLALLAGTGATGERTAQASVSVAAALDDLVNGATAVAVVTPVEQHADWEGGRIVTSTRVRVDRLVAGQLPGEARPVWVRTHGGSVGKIGQIVEGQPTFALGSAALVFLRPHVDPETRAASDAFVVVDGAQGIFSLSDTKPQRLVRAATIGALVDPPRKAVGARAAGDALDGRTLDDAVHEIVAAFERAHGARHDGRQSVMKM